LGQTTAALDLAYIFSTGAPGVPEDDELGLWWYGKAAEAGNAQASGAIGFFHLHGRGGLKQNVERAAQWFEIGADGGDLLSIDALSNMYELGQKGGLPKDHTKTMPASAGQRCQLPIAEPPPSNKGARVFLTLKPAKPPAHL
jgi:TPR repeat protein